MSILLDQITRKKLVLVKQLYQRAVIDSRNLLSKSSRILSVIEFDLAIESLLKAIVGALDTKATPKSESSELIKQASGLLQTASLGTIPDEAHIKYIRQTRNNAQHQAIYPNETQVNDCRTYSRDLLNNIVNQVWDVSFENINLADLIEDDDVKKLLIEAFEQFEQKDFTKAVDFASEAMTKTLQYIEQAAIGRFPTNIDGIAISNGFRSDSDGKLVRTGRSSHQEKELLDAVEKMRETLLYLILEINYSERIKYQQVVGHTFYTMDDKHHRVGGKDLIDQNDAEFILSFSVDSIVRIEERFGSLQKPFGTDWYLAGFH